jgi:hypothetical protein
MKKASEMKKTTRHTEPTEASLKEIPEVDFSKARVRRNPYAARIAKEGITVQVGRGRPRKLRRSAGLLRARCAFPTKSGESSKREPGRGASHYTLPFGKRFSPGLSGRLEATPRTSRFEPGRIAAASAGTRPSRSSPHLGVTA